MTFLLFIYGDSKEIHSMILKYMIKNSILTLWLRLVRVLQMKLMADKKKYLLSICYLDIRTDVMINIA